MDLLRLKAVFYNGIHAFNSLEIIKTVQMNFVLKVHFLRELNTSIISKFMTYFINYDELLVSMTLLCYLNLFFRLVSIFYFRATSAGCHAQGFLEVSIYGCIDFLQGASATGLSSMQISILLNCSGQPLIWCLQISLVIYMVVLIHKCFGWEQFCISQKFSLSTT